MTPADIADAYERLRPELLGFLCRVVVRVAVAEELAQETALRALQHAEKVPADEDGFRAWCFRVAANLAIDHRRRHGTFREGLLLEGRKAAAVSEAFAAASLSLRGSPEMAAVAREHLVACFACTLGQLSPEEAAALLLREVYDFSTDEISDMLGLRPTQVKNRLQTSRAAMAEKYETSCALVNKQGVCYQCVELDTFYDAGAGDPLAGTAKKIDDRLRVLRELRTSAGGTWGRLLSGILDEIG